MIRTRELRYGNLSQAVRRIASAAAVFSAFQFGSIALAQAATPNDFVALLFTGKFKPFSEQLGFNLGPVKKDPSTGGALTSEKVRERNNAVRALYNKLLQTDANFRLFIRGLDKYPELSSPFKLDGQFTQTLEVGVAAMQAFLSVRDKTMQVSNQGQFDLETAKAMCQYVASTKGRQCVE